ncbi:MAG: WG repeat-containing protein [Prevotellaceae bacterium]|jgi:hypothetical protein|nr:WG repeat-containing protein [Prevotellaceae bacterium]
MEGQTVIPLQYDYGYSFSEGLAAVNKGGEWSANWSMMVGGRWGFIDTSGNLIIPHQYRKVVENFHNGKAVVQNLSASFKIDKTGNTVE